MGKIYKSSFSANSEESEIKCFKEEKYDPEELLSLRIDSYDLVCEGKENYYVFWIEVKTKNLTYRVPRRFSDFYELYKFLKTHRLLQFDNFPKKTLFRVKCEVVLKRRKKQLNKFLLFLNKKIRESSIPEVFMFLEFKEFTTLPESDYMQKYSTDYKHDKKLLKFLSRLNFEEDNRLVTFSDIKNYIKKNQPKFTNRYLRLFMLGDGDQLKGFFEISSLSKNDSHLISSAGLSLLEKFLDPGFCKNNSEIVFLFTKLKLEDFKKLKLLDHLKCRKHCRSASFKLMSLYLKHNPLYPEESFFKDEKSLNLFEGWKKLNSINYGLAENHGQIAPLCKENNVNFANMFNFGFSESSLY